MADFGLRMRLVVLASATSVRQPAAMAYAQTLFKRRQELLPPFFARIVRHCKETNLGQCDLTEHRCARHRENAAFGPQRYHRRDIN